MLSSSLLTFNLTLRKCLSSSQYLARGFSNSNQIPKNVAVVLSGCGVYDGSEVHEASAVLVHLSRGGANTHIFAPDKEQMHVINHLTGQPEDNQKRNVLVESARIARGQVKALDLLHEKGFHAVIFPGGFGAAKNLSTFAVDGADMSVDQQTERVLKEFLAARKPIGMCCISPVLAGKVFGKCTVTLGQDTEQDGKWPFAGAVQAITAMGAEHHNKNIEGCVIDEKHLIMTTPAFMCGLASWHEVYDGIGNMVNAVLRFIQHQ